MKSENSGERSPEFFCAAKQYDYINAGCPKRPALVAGVSLRHDTSYKACADWPGSPRESVETSGRE